MRRNKMCSCARKQRGGAFMSPAQVRTIISPVQRRFTTLPVRKPKQKGMGCGCQHGGNFFSDLGSSLTGVFHDPLRALAAVGTLGASEVIAIPADMLKRTTGVRASTVLDRAAPIIGSLGPEAAMGSKATSFGLKQVGLGKKRKSTPKKKSPPAKRRRGKK